MITAKHRRSKHANRAYEIVKSNPGISAYGLAIKLEICKGSIQSVLATCEKHGYLFCEDRYGGLSILIDDY